LDIKLDEQEKKYFLGKRILVVDPNTSSRAGVAKIFGKLGVKATMMTLVKTLDEARNSIKTLFPDFVVIDYSLPDGCGIELLESLRQEHQDADKIVFIVLTNNSSVAAVAHAAEEDTDAFIIKPYTVQSFKKSLLEAVKNKLNPSEYLKIIREGKDHLEQQNVSKAITLFEQALKYSERPSLAYYWRGHSHQVSQTLDKAAKSYEKGLQYNKIHFRCLKGLYEAFSEQKNHREAYLALKRLSHYFPANGERLNSVIRLAIQTRNFEDIELYYKNFLEVDGKNEKLVDYVCAALIVTGKYYFRNELADRGLKCFQKAAISCGGNPRYLQEMIIFLAEMGMDPEARKLMERYPAHFSGTNSFRALKYYVQCKTLSLGKQIEEGRRLLAEGVEEPLLYKALIRASREAGHVDTAEDLEIKAKKRFSSQKNRIPEQDQKPI